VVASGGDGKDTPRTSGLGAGLKRLAKTAKDSSLTQKAADAAASAGRVVSDAVHDVERRKTIIDAATPTLHGALDGAKLRNKKGKVKVWRVARAATRPRKTLTRAGQGAAGASASQVRAAVENAAAGDRRMYSDGQIVAEWSLSDAAEQWARGVTRFENAADGREARDAAELLCIGLASCLTEAPVISDDELAVDAAGNVLAIVLGEQDPSLWDDDERRMLRVALAVARRTGTQPEALGGNGELDLLFDDAPARMRAALAVSTTGWPCDLARWFG
jgi:hypothetical protein